MQALAVAADWKSALRLRCDKRRAVRRKGSRAAYAANRINLVEWTPSLTSRRSAVRACDRPPSFCSAESQSTLCF